MSERDIFIAAIQQDDPAQRRIYLDQACAGQPELRQQVEDLLRVYESAGSFLLKPAADSAATGVFPESGQSTLPTESTGTVIGPYKVLEQIGEGGFGLVFMAEQMEPVRRRVALKILKPGMDTRQVVARFEAERQALAILDHPNIAKVFDGGATPSGRPYFVMELVKGTPITEFCDQNQLAPRERLQLFLQVCHAVQHAHQKGIIHRDLKPSNVLVSRHDTTPIVKVIDFGVAKALGQELTDKTVFTGIAQMIGTPLYMSPEQAGMSDLDVDTRSDIYSLGVLLYELLTGTTPFTKDRFRNVAYDEIRRIIREEEPPKPSTRLSDSKDSLPSISAHRHTEPTRLTKLVRGELDWIVMKALEKNRNRRYETANGFAMDIQRYLADEAVLACPPTMGYRFRKFARRNKAGLAVFAVAVVLVLIGIAGLVVNNRLVTREKEKAILEKERGDRHLARAKKVMEDYFANIANDSRLKIADLHDLRVSLLTSMVAFLEEFVQREGEGWPERVERAWAHINLAKVWAQAGNSEKALAHYALARDAWAALAADNPGNANSRSYLADCDNNRGILLTDLNRLDEAEQSLRQSLETREKLAKEFPAVADHHSSIGGTLHSLSILERKRGNTKVARTLLEQAIPRQETALGIDPKNREARAFLANHFGNLGVVLMELEKPTESAAAITKARAAFEKLNADYPDDPEFLSGIASTWINQGNLWGDDRPEDSVKAYQQAEVIKDKLVTKFPAVPGYRRDLAGLHQNIGLALSGLRRDEEARIEFDKCLSLREQLFKEHPREPDYAKELGVSLLRRGSQEADAGRFEAALIPLTRAIAVLEPLAAPERKIRGSTFLLCNSHGARADVLLRLDRHADAIKDFDRTLVLDDGKRHPYFRMQRAVSLAHLKEHVRATADAEAVAGDQQLPAYLLHDAAVVFAVSSTAVREDAKLSEKYAARAVALLRRAFEKNYQAIAADVSHDKKLAAIQMREDYRKLVKEWEAKQKK